VGGREEEKVWPVISLVNGCMTSTWATETGTVRSQDLTLPKTMATASSPPQPAAPSSRNPVALRLYKILGTNFDDEGTRQALKTVSELYGPSSAARLISRKPVKPSTDSDSDEDEEQDTSATQVTFADTFLGSANVPGDTAARARKHLRRDVENKLTEASHKFLNAFGEVDQVRFVRMCLTMVPNDLDSN